jgi:hypothetical protein
MGVDSQSMSSVNFRFLISARGKQRQEIVSVAV